MMTVFAAKERVPASTNDRWISCLLCAQKIASLPPSLPPLYTKKRRRGERRKTDIAATADDVDRER